MSKNDSLDDRVKALEGKVKKYAAIATITVIMLGGGGVFGIAQWAYKAPLEKQVVKYESAMKSLSSAIEAANDSGEKELTSKLRTELVSLDRNYRTALGLIEQCMQVLSRSNANQRDPETSFWLKKTSQELQRLRNQKT